MTYRQLVRAAARRSRAALSAALFLTVFLAVAGFLSGHFPAIPPGSPAAGNLIQQGGAQGQGAPLSEADGLVPEGSTVFDSGISAVANLDPDLFTALRLAAEHATDNGVDIFVTSGWRSRQYQEHLLQEAITEYGSAEAASRWVATAQTSPHVSGDAVDVGPAHASAWLAEHGGGYGLCQIYDNEPWHYELRATALHDGCPPRYSDPTHDPRMQRTPA